MLRWQSVPYWWTLVAIGLLSKPFPGWQYAVGTFIFGLAIVAVFNAKSWLREIYCFVSLGGAIALAFLDDPRYVTWFALAGVILVRMLLSMFPHKDLMIDTERQGGAPLA